MMEGFFPLRNIAATYSYFWYPGRLLILLPRNVSSNLASPSVQKVTIVIAGRNAISKTTRALSRNA